MPPTRGISCLSLVLYGIRIGGWLPLEMEYISSVGNIILTVDLTHNMLLLIPAFTLSRLGCRTEQSLVCGYLDAKTAFNPFVILELGIGDFCLSGLSWNTVFRLKLVNDFI